LLDRELFMTLRKAEVLMTVWAHVYDPKIPHGGLIGCIEPPSTRRYHAMDRQ
jgi:hypothetical protein